MFWGLLKINHRTLKPNFKPGNDSHSAFFIYSEYLLKSASIVRIGSTLTNI